MARLEIQINQIYYLPAENKQVSLVLTDEVLNNSSHLFVIGHIANIEKKTEISELTKISEAILATFRENKKLTGENLFETSLAHINQSLADLAHGGKKSWIGKFSALVALKSSDSIFLASSGSVSSLLYRKGEFTEILSPEKPGLHPLKTFTNFTSGKLKSQDILLLTTSNLTNYVALQNLSKLLSEDSADRVSEQVSKILKETSKADEGFASFFVTLTKPVGSSEAAPIAVKNYIEPEKKEEAVVSAPVLEDEEIYAPLPKDLKKIVVAPTTKEVRIFQRMPKLSMPKLTWRLPKPKFWEHLSAWAKFCLIMFLLVLILLAANVIKYGFDQHRKTSQNAVGIQIDNLNKDLSDAESALIYRNQDQAIKSLNEAFAVLNNIKSLNADAYAQYQPKLAELSNRINHITVVNTPNTLATLKHAASYMVRAGKGFVFADPQSGTVTTYQTSSNDQQPKDLFLLNKIGTITGLVHIPSIGNVVTTSSEMYLVNDTQNQFDLLHIYPKTSLSGLRYIPKPDRIYTLDQANNKVLRIAFSTQVQNAPESALKSAVDLSKTVDFAVDSDVWLLSNSDLVRYTNGTLNNSFKLAQPTDQITSANKLFIAANIYILESAKKRLLVYNKSGALITQMLFPSTSDLKDIYVDESSRNIYLLDSNKLLSITF